MAKKNVDALKAKQKKQKIVAAVLGVAFIGVMVFQVPRVMKMMKSPAPPVAQPSTTTTPAGTPTLAAPTLGGAQEPGPTTGSTGSLVATTVTVQDGQLTSFSRFTSKDPFAQQLSDTPNSEPSPASSGGSSSGGAAGSGAPSVPGNAPAPGSAVISVNGTLYSVATGTDFPQPTPIFHLVSVTAHTAKISIAGGSYSTGAKAITLRENKPVTLMNTADGTRYTLILKPLGTAVPTATNTGPGTSGGTGTTPTQTQTTVTLPPATP
ncbi:MAG: hypothetical protein V7645_761 [Actinomycetota bacterium]|jgi:hypothetical protein